MKIYFTSDTWHEFKKGMQNYSAKCEMLQYVPKVIETGKYITESQIHHHDDTVQFHTFKKKIKHNKVDYDIKVAVKERTNKPKYLAYSFGWEDNIQNQKQRHLADHRTIVSMGDIHTLGSGNQPAIASNRYINQIITEYDVVNIEIEKTPDQIILEAKNTIDQSKRIFEYRRMAS